MPEGCKERLSWEFLHYVAMFNRIKRPKILKKMKAQKGKKTIHILKNDKEIKAFLDTMHNNKT